WIEGAGVGVGSGFMNVAEVVVVDREKVLNRGRLERKVDSAGITVMFLTMALFNQLAREAAGVLRRLKWVLFGGEVVDPQWPRKVLREGGPEHLVHVYGPTETTTFATWHEVRESEQG